MLWSVFRALWGFQLLNNTLHLERLKIPPPAEACVDILPSTPCSTEKSILTLCTPWVLFKHHN